MQPTVFQFALLGFTAPRALVHSVVNARRLSTGDPENAVLSLLDLCHELESRPVEPAGHDPIDECIRLVRNARRSRAGRLHRLIAAAYTRLTPEARQGVRAHVGAALPGLVGVLAGSESELARRSAVDLAHDSNDPGLIPCMVSLAEDPVEPVAAGAREAVLRLSGVLAAGRMRGGSDAFRDAAILSVVLASCDQFPSHRSTEIMEAAVLLLDPLGLGELSGEQRGGGRWLAERDEAVRLGLRSALRRVRGPIGRLRAWQMLAEHEMRTPAIHRLLAERAGGDLGFVLEQAHLGIRAARRRPIDSRVTRAQRHTLIPTHGEIERATNAARRGLCHWIDAVSPDVETLDAVLEPLLADHDPCIRLSALRRSPGSLVRDFAFDDSPAIAASATLRLVCRHRDVLTDDLKSKLSRSPHAAVRGLLRPRAVGCVGSVLALRGLASDRDGAMGQLRTKLTSESEHDLIAAVHVIRRLGIADEFTEDLVGVLERAFRRDDSPAWRVISSVLSVVPELPHPSVARLLAAARSHHDARVRANAVEAEPRRPRGRVSSMVELVAPACEDKHHRVRTSALRVLLRDEAAPDDTVDRVLGTLGEQEQAARAAALWLIERSVVELRLAAGRRWQDIAARVAELARSGDDDAERARATRCARRMLSEMKA